jgi:hypothetical protein
MHGVELISVSVVYLLLAVVILARRPRDIAVLFKDGVRTSYRELARSE